MARRRASALAVTGLLLSAGCGGSSEPPPNITPANPPVESLARGPAPDWVMRTPRESGRICAVGAVDPTFYRQDGMRYAGEAARSELARAIEVRISTVMYDYQSTRGQQVDQVSVEQVVGSLSEVVLNGAQVMETWYDELGSISRKGMTYALACMDTNRSVADLAERLKAAGGLAEQQIQDVRERAQEAFDELEAMEEKQEEQRAAPVPDGGPGEAPEPLSGPPASEGAGSDAGEASGPGAESE